MFLKYKEKNQNKTRYDYEVYQIYDPFDKESEYNKALKSSKTLNKTFILINPKYGTVVTRENLDFEFQKFLQIPELPITNSTPTVTNKDIMLQFVSRMRPCKQEMSLMPTKKLPPWEL